VDFDDLNFASQTSWDNYIKSLTPELPSLLSDFLEIQLPDAGFAVFWAKLKCELSQAEMQHCARSICPMALIMTNYELELSQSDFP
jgi:hypothetical protein